MKLHTYPEAKRIIQSICKAAGNGEYDTREKFLAVLDEHSYVAAQGYNAFGKIFFWNTASADLYGHSERAVINKDIFELIMPDELKQFARDMVQLARRTRQLPDPSSCDLLRHNGEFVTVYSGHLVFQWEEGTEPEFYCIDVGIDSESV